MKPYAIIRPQPELFQVYNVTVTESINPEILVPCLKMRKPNVIKMQQPISNEKQKVNSFI